MSHTTSTPGPATEPKTLGRPRHSRRELANVKGEHGISVSVCLPALNEASTIGTICRRIRTSLMEEVPLVDEIVVVDSGSDDDTLEESRRAGAVAHRSTDILPMAGLPPAGGKGEALWKSLAVLSGDLVVWMDSDTRNFDPDFVGALVEPLLMDESIALVKAYYDRPLEGEGPNDGLATGGARVTELAARPLVNLLYPPLAKVIQPLSGEYAARRDMLIELPFLTGYGVDIGLLMDVAERHGASAVAQVDLGVRFHRNRSLLELGQMSFQVNQALLVRLQAFGLMELKHPLQLSLTQFWPGAGGYAERRVKLGIIERPPMATVLPDHP